MTPWLQCRSFVNNVASGDVEKRNITAVAVEDQDFAESVPGQAANIGDVTNNGFAMHRDGAGEVHVVLVEGIVDGWQENGAEESRSTGRRDISLEVSTSLQQLARPADIDATRTIALVYYAFTL